MTARLKKTLAVTAAVTAIGGLGVAGAAAAGAFDEDAGSERAEAEDGGGLTGTAADRARRAARSAVPGARVLEVEADDDGGSAYEAEVRRPDGSVVEVRLDRAFRVEGVTPDD
jgi:uncharacterized membrane protein YkoI